MSYCVSREQRYVIGVARLFGTPCGVMGAPPVGSAVAGSNDCIAFGFAGQFVHCGGSVGVAETIFVPKAVKAVTNGGVERPFREMASSMRLWPMANPPRTARRLSA